MIKNRSVLEKMLVTSIAAIVEVLTSSSTTDQREPSYNPAQEKDANECIKDRYIRLRRGGKRFAAQQAPLDCS